MENSVDLHALDRTSGINTDVSSKNTPDHASMTETMLHDIQSDTSHQVSYCVPIAELSTLGAGIASLIPALRTITATTTVDTHGLYRLANASVGDVLKKAKNGNFWGAFKTAEGTSKFVQLQEAGPLSSTTTAVMPINPAAIMMAAALFSIEKQLGNIEKMEKQILSFLERNKKSEIEADMQTLVEIMNQYKFNWDNQHYVASNHKMVLDIKRTARKHMNSYQKQIAETISKRVKLINQLQLNSMIEELLEEFTYYRLSLYAFSMASFLEVLLSGNFQEGYIVNVRTEIESLSLEYRGLYTQCSAYVERLSGVDVGQNIRKGLGAAGKTVGKFIGKIPVIEKGPVDEFLQDQGSRLEKGADRLDSKRLLAFAKVKDPATMVFTKKLEDMVQIYNHTAEICFDRDNIYLVEG